MEQAVGFRSYLIRIWPRHVQGQPAYTISLESVSTGTRIILPDLPSLIAFLESPAGNDTIVAGIGNDMIDGGPGIDTCHAGGGHNSVTSCEM